MLGTLAMRATTSRSYLSVVTSEGGRFHVPRRLLRQSLAVAKYLEELGVNEDMVLVDDVHVEVTQPIFSLVIEWCRHHEDDPPFDEALWEQPWPNRTKTRPSDWDLRFLRKLEKHALFDITTAANGLEIKGLVDVCCYAVANLIQEMPKEEQMRLIKSARLTRHKRAIRCPSDADQN